MSTAQWGAETSRCAGAPAGGAGGQIPLVALPWGLCERGQAAKQEGAPQLGQLYVETGGCDMVALGQRGETTEPSPR